jgi:hypothetical protein
MRLINADTPENQFGVSDADLLALDEIRRAPTVDAEVVVRCKDCKHYALGVCLKIYSDGNEHPEAWQSRKPEDFCSYGERNQ